MNTARGGLLESLDVVERALRSGTAFRRAASMPYHRSRPAITRCYGLGATQAAWVRGRLIITPHTAWYSENAAHDMRHKAAETVALYLRHGTLRHRIV